ncbi:MAG: DUF2283 domain-containing protein [Candidatus Bipolaricaulia bacterium]
MAKARIVQEEDVLKAAADMLKLPSKRLWVDYDEEADVLYISFRKPQRASESIMEGELIYHYDNDDELVGITVMNVKALRDH